MMTEPSDEMEEAFQRCMADVLADKPKKETRWQLYLWHRRWRKEEYILFSQGGMWGTLQWYILKESLNRIGGFW